jgi:hypothetical protein
MKMERKLFQKQTFANKVEQRRDTRHNDTWRNATWHSDAQNNNIQYNDTYQNVVLIQTLSLRALCGMTRGIMKVAITKSA